MLKEVNRPDIAKVDSLELLFAAFLFDFELVKAECRIARILTLTKVPKDHIIVIRRSNELLPGSWSTSLLRQFVLEHEFAFLVEHFEGAWDTFLRSRADDHCI